MDSLVYQYQINEYVTAGMTFRQAGNFWPSQPESSNQTLIFSHEILRLLDREVRPSEESIFIMRAEKHGGQVIIWHPLKGAPREEICDGVIWEGPGMAVCFPGGCPIAVFSSKQSQMFGLLHLSWKTVASRIITNFLAQWNFCGGEAKNTELIFLPSICAHCLTFDHAYWNNCVLPELIWTDISPDDHIVKKDGRLGFDLVGYAKKILTANSFDCPSEQPECTCCKGRFWCYRHHDTETQKYRNAGFFIAEPIPHLA